MYQGSLSSTVWIPSSNGHNISSTLEINALDNYPKRTATFESQATIQLKTNAAVKNATEFSKKYSDFVNSENTKCISSQKSSLTIDWHG